MNIGTLEFKKAHFLLSNISIPRECIEVIRKTIVKEVTAIHLTNVSSQFVIISVSNSSTRY